MKTALRGLILEFKALKEEKRKEGWKGERVENFE